MHRDISDAEFLCVLQEILSAFPNASQRDIAARMDISLGLTNNQLAHLADIGWISTVPMGGRKMRYSLTDAGTAAASGVHAERMREAFSVVKRCGEAIGCRIRSAKENGITRVVLFGESEIDFLIEYVCSQNGMAFETSDFAGGLRGNSVPDTEGVLRVMGENVRETEPADGCMSIFELTAE